MKTVIDKQMNLTDQLFLTELKLKVLKIAANVQDRIEMNDTEVYNDDTILEDLKSVIMELD